MYSIGYRVIGFRVQDLLLMCVPEGSQEKKGDLARQNESKKGLLFFPQKRRPCRAK
jgi:hypothetical protein